jgi:hypothetical protein
LLSLSWQLCVLNTACMFTWKGSIEMVAEIRSNRAVNNLQIGSAHKCF